MVALGFDLEADELRTGEVPVLLQTVRVDEARDIVRGIGDDGGQQ